MFEHDGSEGWQRRRPAGARAQVWRGLLCLLLFGLMAADLNAETFRDEFGSVSYGNNDGTRTWATDWLEQDDNGLPASGNVWITAGELSLDDRPNSGGEPSAEREADLSGFTAATLSVDFRTTAGVDNSDSVVAEVSANGGSTWTQLENFTNINGASSGSRSYDITGEISANTRVRFRVNNAYGGGNESFRVDNVEIDATALVVGTGDGLLGTYYDQNAQQGQYFTGATVQRVDPQIDFDWGSAAPDAGIGNDDFSVRWTGQVEAMSSGDYTFYTRSDDGVRLWIDGVPVIDNWTDHAATENSSAPITLVAGTRYDIQMEFYERGGLAVAELRWSGPGVPKQLIPQSQLYSNTVPPPGPTPTGEWRLDEASWDGTPGEVVDNSGNGLDGAAFNGATAVPARVCNGAELDGASGTGAFIRIADDPLLDVTDELTVTAWINPDVLPSGGNLKTILSKDENYEFHLENDEVYWWWNTSGGQTRTFRTNGANIAVDNWYHIAIVYSRSRGEQKIYVNGVEMPAQGGSTTTSTEALLTNADPLEIGGDQGFAGREFDGLIDEVKVFRSALTAAEIAAIVAATRPCQPGATGLIARWPLDETAGTTAAEVVNGNDGTYRNGVGLADRLGQCPGTAVSFDGNNDYVEIPHSDDYLLDNGTVAFWFRAQNVGTSGLFSKDSQGNDTGGHLTIRTIRNGGQRRLWVRLQGVSDESTLDVNLGNGLQNNTWYHVAVTFGSGGLRLYLDGVEIASDAGFTRGLGTTSGGIGNFEPIVLGANSWASNDLQATPLVDWFRGWMDEVVIYDRALTPSDIGDLVNCQLPGPTVDHYRILHDGSALTCQPESVTVQACGDANCTVLFTGTATVTLSPTGWVGGDTQIITGGQGVFDLRHVTPEAVLLGIGSATPLANNPVRCFLSGVEGDCAMTFHESGFVFDVPDQVSCTTSANVTVSAVRADDTSQRCVPAFANVTRTLSLWSTYASPAAPANPQPLAVNGTPVATASPGTAFNLAFDANGETPISVAYQEAGRLQLDARYTGSGADAGLVMVGNDSFVYRPHGFFLGATTDGVTALGNTTDSGDPRWRAGEDFQLQVRAQCQDGTITQNYVPTSAEVFAEMINPTEAAGAAPGALTVKGSSFNGSFLSAPLWQNISAPFSQGVIVEGGQPVSGFANASFNEVGVINLHVRDGSYLGTAIPEATLAVGRFTPDHFETSGLQDGALSDGCGGFTYTGQEDAGRGAIRYLTTPAFTVTAKEKGGATTRNYTGGFVKLVAGGVVITPPLQDATRLGADAATRMAVTANINPGSLADNGDGTLTYTLGDDDFLYDRDANAAIGPFTSDLRLDIATATDGDGIAASDLVKTLRPVGVEIRYGRVAIQNAFGSELLDLAVPLTAQYLDAGGNYVANSLDSCTDLTLTLADVSAGDNLDVPNDTCVQDNGSPGDSGAGCVPPGPAGRQYTEPPTVGGFNLYLLPPGAGKTGSADVQVDAPTWLEFDWNGTGDEDPTGRATFGLFRGSPNIIHMREPWN